MSIPTTPPSGFRDFLPEACAARAHAIQTISLVYRSFGFNQIATSAVEDLEVLLGKGGGETEKLIFKILKRGEKLEEAKGGSELADLGLRFDLTLPLARFYSRHGSRLPHPFKAFQIGPVWRAERAQKGRYREFYQCDADIIGSESPLCEAEVIRAMSSAFLALGLEQPTVLLNDRTLLDGLFEMGNIPREKRLQACVLLDKQDKMERPALLSELETLVGAEKTKFLETVVMAAEPDEDRLAAADSDAMRRLQEIHRILGSLFPNPKTFRLAPSLVRGLDYYTGPVFEFRHPKLAGSLGGGGRYDRLTEKFGVKAVPACGGSIGFERLMLLLEEAKAGPALKRLKACMTVFSEELRPHALSAAAALRATGWDVDVYPGAGKLGAQFKYADATGALAALVIGPDEAAAAKVKVKDLRSGAERLETLEAIIAGGPAKP